MATEFSNGKQTVKLYRSVNRGKEMFQLAFYQAGRRIQKNFSDKAEAKRVAKQILGGLTNDAQAVEAMATPELESLVAARKVLVGGYKHVFMALQANRQKQWQRIVEAGLCSGITDFKTYEAKATEQLELAYRALPGRSIAVPSPVDAAAMGDPERFMQPRSTPNKDLTP